MTPAELERRVEHLSGIIRKIDIDVAQAAKKYLKNVPAGTLEFTEFLDLLVTQVREEFKDKALLKCTLRELVKDRLEEKLQEFIPKLKGRLSDYLTLPIIILPKTYEIRDHLLIKTAPSYRAISVRGVALRSVGPTPEDAYQEIRKRVACQIFGSGAQETAKQLSVRDWELAKKFEIAKPFLTDEIEGFKIEARLLSKDG